LLSQNLNAIQLLEQNINKVSWLFLSENPGAIHLLEQNINKINWKYLSLNPNAIHLLEQNIDKINWWNISENSNIFEIDKTQSKYDIHAQIQKINKTDDICYNNCCIL